MIPTAVGDGAMELVDGLSVGLGGRTDLRGCPPACDTDPQGHILPDIPQYLPSSRC